ncbi:MAG: pentapeptide repeat-containing protein [Candidatus Eisenbacteria bacterium]|uniref:Pentapeptide repeat-containing protein n=1 Tax=Eiseniibacteriota bacterium TaxID=2212470 RepID=A0A948S0X2_UNCEI|nr:pentapeptide repeat-containing protein [Candidatus Eisenbacteria bacterium]MBU1947267.1 pentapeptide repeat-containing protein [Candidatus Eisenbacteria bacterium]MBU2691804.1 pentapeptide repeat-containing protein [Candidatus Eisenbacteria bacterium]
MEDSASTGWYRVLMERVIGRGLGALGAGCRRRPVLLSMFRYVKHPKIRVHRWSGSGGPQPRRRRRPWIALRRAVFRRAALRPASLRGAVLRRASLRRAVLRRTPLRAWPWPRPII